MCSLLLLLLLLLCTDQVASQSQQGGDNRLILKGGSNSNPCEGYILVSHKNEWGYVGDINWHVTNGDVVCRSIDCGVAERHVEKMYIVKNKIPDLPDKVWINEVNCSAKQSADQLWDCPGFRGWGVSGGGVDTHDLVRWITCSKKIEMGLDGFKCAGAVQFNITEGGRSDSHYVCSDNWGTGEEARAKAHVVCNNLNCGGATAASMPDPAKMTSPEGFSKSKQKKKIKCAVSKLSEKVDNLWQCQPQNNTGCSKPAFVTCKDHPVLRLEGGENACSGSLKVKAPDGVADGDIWDALCNGTATKISPHTICKQLNCGTNATQSFDCSGRRSGSPTLTCKENIMVTLKDSRRSGPPSCYGSVYVSSSLGERPVCGTGWSRQAGEVVCRELQCGAVVFHMSIVQDNHAQHPAGPAILDNVECTGHEKNLWHCKAQFNLGAPCRTHAHVTCENSTEVRLSDGPGKCDGIVEIKHDGEWKLVVHSDEWKKENSNSVCKELAGCGDAKSTSKSDFTLKQGSFFQKKVTCESSSQKLSDCIKDVKVQVVPGRDSNMPVHITCHGQKVVFLMNARSSCSGHVAVEHEEKDYWLSGSNETWNKHTADVVCRTLHCGTARTFRADPPVPSGASGMENEPWTESYNCVSTEASVFDCPNERAPSNLQSIAFVECTGDITATLTDDCWGNVKVSMDGTVGGGVCASTWTEKQSSMLCEDLGCGRAFPNKQDTKKTVKVSILSMTQTKQTRNLTESTIVKKIRDTDCDDTPASVVCSASVAADFGNSSDHCSGNVMIRYKGQRRPVCNETLQEANVRNTICKDLGCGEAIKTLDFFGPQPPPSQHGLSGLTCPPERGNTLAGCNIEEETSQKCTLVGLKCDKWQKITLKKPKDKACEGDVMVYSKGGTEMVSSHGWTSKEGDKLCNDLNLGKYRNHTDSTRSVSPNYYGETFRCNGTEKSLLSPRWSSQKTIWGCERTAIAHSPKEGVYLQCTDNPEVKLSAKCAGELTIGNKRVCAKNWNEKYSQIVCQELRGCSDALPFQKGIAVRTYEDVHHVRCEGTESNLGLCETVSGACNDALVSVRCKGGIQFRTTEKCGGVIEVKYEDEKDDKWENMCVTVNGFDDKFKELLCKELHRKNENCGEVVKKLIYPTPIATLEENRKMTLDCNVAYMLIQDCVKQAPCGNVAKPAATIYCDGYEEKAPPPTTRPPDPTTSTMTSTMTEAPPPPPPSNVGLIVGVSLGAVGVAMVLLVLVLCLFLRRRMFHMRNRKPSQKDLEYDSGEYEDVDINPEMKALNSFGSRSKAAVDAGSDSSLSYDDIDNEEVASGAAGPAPSCHKPRDYINTRRPDTVTYEVEDPQEEEYDDVDTVPDIRVTPAEVHGSPPPPGGHPDPLLLRGGPEEDPGDYLEPDTEGHVKWE